MDPQFPLELLQKIFLLLVKFHLREPSHRTRRPEWITITHVCRYWREAALGLRELWTYITLNLSISWSLAMMERSAPLPVHIDRYIGESSRIGVKALATSGLLSASRIRTLRLIGRPADILEVLNHLCSPSPLESLTLLITGAEEPVNIPETLCARDTPHFRRLTFETSMCIGAPLWLLAGVTHFTTSANVLIREHLSTLQAMPQLEELRVSHLFNDREPGHLPLAHVALPRLSLLTVHSNSPQFFVDLSAHIVGAPPTTLRRHFFWRLFSLQEWEPKIFTAMFALIPHDSAPGADDGGLRAAQVTGGPERGSFEVWSRSARSACTGCSDALFLFRLHWWRVLHRALEADGIGYCPFFHLASLCALLQTTRVVDLTVAPLLETTPYATPTAVEEEGMQPKVVTQWHALLMALPSVKILRLHRCSSAGASVLHAIATSPGLLPQLRKVFVVQSIVRYAGGVADTDAGSAMANRDIVRVNIGAELVEAVRVRSGLEVVLVRCEIDEEALEALRKRDRVDFGNEWEYMQSVSLES